MQMWTCQRHGLCASVRYAAASWGLLSFPFSWFSCPPLGTLSHRALMNCNWNGTCYHIPITDTLEHWMLPLYLPHDCVSRSRSCGLWSSLSRRNSLEIDIDHGRCSRAACRQLSIPSNIVCGWQAEVLRAGYRRSGRGRVHVRGACSCGRHCSAMLRWLYCRGGAIVFGLSWMMSCVRGHRIPQVARRLAHKMKQKNEGGI